MITKITVDYDLSVLINLVDPPYTSILHEPISLITEQTRKRYFIYIQNMYIDPSMMAEERT